MAQLTLGPLTVTITPVAVMKCFVGLQQWLAHGSPEALAEYRCFRNDFFPYLLGRPDDEPIVWFCACIDHLSSDLPTRTGRGYPFR